MWKLLLKTYGKWVLLFGSIILLVLSSYAVYFSVHYPQIRKGNYIETLDSIEQLLEDKKGFPTDVDFDYALKTIRRMKELIKNDQLVYQDFSKMRMINQLPLNKRVTGRQYHQLFKDLNQLMDVKLAGKLDQWDEVVGIKSATHEMIPDATP